MFRFSCVIGTAAFVLLAVHCANAQTSDEADEVRASHILVKTEKEAWDIISQLQKGADFAKLAKEKSIDQSKNRNGGDLGFFYRETMVKEFSDAAFALKKGEITKTPIKSVFGWHVIMVTDRRAGTTKAVGGEDYIGESPPSGHQFLNALVKGGETDDPGKFEVVGFRKISDSEYDYYFRYKGERRNPVFARRAFRTETSRWVIEADRLGRYTLVDK